VWEYQQKSLEIFMMDQKKAAKAELLEFKKKYVEMASRFLKKGAFVRIST
jgi:hypothetical protein